MPEVLINGRRVAMPEVTNGRQIQAAGGIDANRRLIRRTRTGNFLVKPDDRVHVSEESVFIDAPQRGGIGG